MYRLPDPGLRVYTDSAPAIQLSPPDITAAGAVFKTDYYLRAVRPALAITSMTSGLYHHP